MKRLVAVLACTLVVAACSSTAKKTSTGRSGTADRVEVGESTAGNDVAASGEADAGTGQDGTVAGTGARRPGAKSSRAGSGTATDAPNGGGGVAGSVTGRLGQGVTGDTIKVGFVAQSGGDEFYKSFGLPVSFGDDRQMIGALLDDLNKRGGINGRKVKPVFGDVNVPSADQRSDASRLCSLFAEDQKVFAVLNYYWVSWPDYFSCLSQKKLVHFSAAATTGDDEFMRQLAPYYQIPSLKGDNRLWRTVVPLLKRQNFFPAGAKVGLIVADMPMYNRVADTVIKPQMAAIGAPIKSVFKTTFTYADAEIGSLQSQMAQAVLRFKSAGITHLLFTPGGYMALMFMNNAETQSYRPKYVINTDMSPGILFELAAPKAQLKGSMGLGWRPAWDVTDKQLPYTAQEQRCFKILRDHGVNVQSRSSPGNGPPECDLVWAFEAAAKKAGPTLNIDTLLGALRSLGTSWQSVLTFRSDFGRGRQDSSFAHRLLYFNDGCQCFAYRGEILPDIG